MKNTFRRMGCGVVCMIIVVLLNGCVSKIPEEKHSPVLMISQNSDGDVTLSWDTVVGYRYRLYQMDRGDTEWTPFGRTFDGTGERISLNGNAGRKSRRYWIQADEITP